jgi:prepilin-type N-terminal cleavage/methylation domain-containing protein
MHSFIKNSSGFSLIEIVIVIAIIGILAAITVISLKPREIFANGRNSQRVTDVSAINSAIGQWLSREGINFTDPYDELGLLDPGISALTPSDGTITDEGLDANTVSTLKLPAYLSIIPTDPNGTEYRVGVDSLSDPKHVLVCTDGMEFTPSYPESAYPDHIFCQSN